MMASSYGWAAVVAGILAILVVVALWISRGKTAAVTAAAKAAECEDAARKALEQGQVANVERRDLPAGAAGGRVHDVPGSKLGDPPGAPGA